jgi:hypothetical protein
MIKRLPQLILIAISLSISPTTTLSQGFEDANKSVRQYIENKEKLKNELIGNEIWFYPNRERCRKLNIYREPDTNSDKYITDKAIKIKISSNVVAGPYKNDYFKILTEDGSVGYLPSSDICHINDGKDKLMTCVGEYENKLSDLTDDCLFTISPLELQAIIDKRIGAEEAKGKADLAAYIKKSEDSKLKEEQVRAEIARVDELAIQEKQKQQDEALQSQAPQILSDMDKDDFCVAYGKYLAKQKIKEIGSLEKNLSSLMKTEVKKRKLVIRTKYASTSSVRPGMTDCELFAAVGLPTKRNRDVGELGVHVQNIYNFYGGSDFYVYTENGRVTSWQDSQ